MVWVQWVLVCAVLIVPRLAVSEFDLVTWVNSLLALREAARPGVDEENVFSYRDIGPKHLRAIRHFDGVFEGKALTPKQYWEINDAFGLTVIDLFGRTMNIGLAFFNTDVVTQALTLTNLYSDPVIRRSIPESEWQWIASRIYMVLNRRINNPYRDSQEAFLYRLHLDEDFYFKQLIAAQLDLFFLLPYGAKKTLAKPLFFSPQNRWQLARRAMMLEVLFLSTWPHIHMEQELKQLDSHWHHDPQLAQFQLNYLKAVLHDHPKLLELLALWQKPLKKSSFLYQRLLYVFSTIYRCN